MKKLPTSIGWFENYRLTHDALADESDLPYPFIRVQLILFLDEIILNEWRGHQCSVA